MNSEDKRQIKRLWIQMSAYYQAQLNDMVLDMYAEDLDGLTPAQVAEAMNQYRRNPKNMRMPLPAQIRAVMSPGDDDDSQSREAAARITNAISKYGYSNPTEARAYMGEVAWAVVQKQGGWTALCENVMTDQIPVLQAQWRELAKVQIQLSRAGRLDEPPKLPEGPRHLEVTNIVKGLATGSFGKA